LCFVGNFPSRDLYFFRSEIGKQHGLNRSLYFTDYAINDSVRAKAYQHIDLTGDDIPLTDPLDAINHFWHANFEPFQMSSSCPIYLPIYDGHISSCKYEKNHLLVIVEINKNLVMSEDLSISVIEQRKSGGFRKRYKLKENRLEIEINHDPDYALIFLNKDSEKLDEYYYSSTHSIEREKDLLERLDQSRGLQKEPIDFIVHEPASSQTNEIKQIPDLPLEEIGNQVILVDKKLVNELPSHIQSLLLEAESAFQYGLYRSTAILIRSALEEGITLAIQKNGKEEDLYENDYEIGLQKKIRLASNTIRQLANIKADLELVKWFGDKASHEAHYPIYKTDITNNLEPKFRLFITKLIELKFNKV
jgi:hypothetical protein